MSYDYYRAPQLVYNITKKSRREDGTIVDVPVEIGETVRLSFSSPFNEIHVTYNSNISLTYYEVRVTNIDAGSEGEEEWDIGEGNLAYRNYGSIAANVDHTYTINVTPNIFDKGDGTYRVGLYAKSAIDGVWDVTYLLFTVEGLQVATTDADGVMVLTKGYKKPEDDSEGTKIVSGWNATNSGGELSIE